MLKAISEHGVLNKCITNSLTENDCGVLINQGLDGKYIALDIDNYYHSLGLEKCPPTADRLLIIRCLVCDDGCSVYVYEMKNVKRSQGFSVKNIYDKFTTTIDDFMKVKFQDVFLNPDYRVKTFRVLFISDAYRLLCRGYTKDEIRSFLSGTKIDILQSLPPFKYKNKVAMIEYELPNPVICQD